jgi:putative membrane protein
MQCEFRQVKLASVVVLAALVVTGCSSQDRAAGDSVVERGGEMVGAASDTMAGRMPGGTSGNRTYTNTEMLGYLDFVNNGEIEMGKMAQPKATNAEVKSYAQRIVTDHTTLKNAASKLAQSQTLTPAAPQNNDDLQKDHQEHMKELTEQAKGKEFDQKFLQNQIEMHRKVLGDIENALNNNQNAELRPLLEQARTSVQAHLTQAEDLEKRVSGN